MSSWAYDATTMAKMAKSGASRDFDPGYMEKGRSRLISRWGLRWDEVSSSDWY